MEMLKSMIVTVVAVIVGVAIYNAISDASK